MGRADRIEADFAPGIRLPAELRLLCDYLDRTDYPISGCMKLRPDDGAVKAWFGGDAEAANQFAAFGAGPDGSILAFWLYRGPDTSTAPVIHLGSEGQNNVVLASDFRDFLKLFGIGYDELGFADLGEPPIEPETARRLRVWLFAEFGITCPATGAALVQQAQGQHPDLEAWVRDWQRRRANA